MSLPDLFAAGKTRKLGLLSSDDRLLRLPRLTIPVSGPSSEDVDLEPYFPPVHDQGDLGSCADNMGCEVFFEYLQRRAGNDTPYSRLYLYWWTRKLAGLSPDEDNGSSIYDVVRAATEVGCCPESMWNYDDPQVRFAFTPPPEADQEAEKHKLLFSYLCPSVESIDASLEQGFPVGFGMHLTQSFEQVDGSGIYLPSGSDIGGHAMVAIGVRNTMKAGGYTGFFKVRNSWSTGWGAGGNVLIPKKLFMDGTAGEAVTGRRSTV